MRRLPLLVLLAALTAITAHAQTTMIIVAGIGIDGSSGAPHNGQHYPDGDHLILQVDAGYVF